jgi:predicted transposase/invertase (TIGR01784 family)
METLLKEKKKFYTAKYDKVFKAVLCDEDDLSLLKEFLERLLHLDIEEISLLQTEQSTRYIEERRKLIDVLVKVNNNYIHIELNSQNKNFLRVRNFVFFTEIYSKKTKTSEDYIDLETFIHIDLTYGLGKNDRVKQEYCVMNEEGETYVDNFKIIEYNMDKLMNFWYTKNEEEIKKYKDLIMLDLDQEELEELTKISGDDKFMKEFEKKVTDLNEEPWFTSWIGSEEDNQKILNSEKKLSFLEGEEKNKLETARNFKNLGVSFDTISKATGLSLEEIEKL